MNYELDLRSPECRDRSKMISSKATWFVLYLLSLSLLIAFSLMLDGYRMKLETDIVNLKSELADKQVAAAPLIEMTAELETSIKRSEIMETLLSGYLIKADYIKIINQALLPGHKINNLTINAEGDVEIRGQGTTLQEAALCAKKLQDFSFIHKAELSTADVNEESSCTFTIKASLKHPAGGVEIEW